MEKSIFNYEKNNTGVTLRKFLSGGELVLIPAVAEDAGELTGLPVTSIGSECFKENGIMISKLIVPDSVRILEHDAFAYLVSLEELILPETIEIMGADYLIASGLDEAYIPASVNMVERPELIDRRFRVSPDNKTYSSDGFGLYETRDGIKTLVAVNASDNRESYDIAIGTKKIASRALRDISTLKRLHIPAELDMIEEGSLSFTGGKASGSNGIEEISVARENKSFIIKYESLCIRDENEKLTLLKYFGDKSCRLGDDVIRVGNRCFKNTKLEEIYFYDELSRSSKRALQEGSFRMAHDLKDNTKREEFKDNNKILCIGNEAFSGCILKYAYFDEGSIFFGEEDQFVTEDFVLEFGKNGKLYDFGLYDNFLKKQYLTEPRIRMICHRLQNPVDLDQTTEYALRYKINEELSEIIRLLAFEHNCRTLNDLGELGFFNADNIDFFLDLAVMLEEKEMTAWFMSYKNANIKADNDLGFL